MAIKIDLAALRKHNGLKQAEFAEKIGIKQAYLSELETGKKPLPTTLYNTLIEVFGEETCDNFAISQEDGDTEQHFHGDINGNNPQFAGRDISNTGGEFDKFISALTAQADLTKEAHDLTRRAQVQVDKAQAQIDRLITIIELKLNIASL